MSRGTGQIRPVQNLAAVTMQNRRRTRHYQGARSGPPPLVPFAHQCPLGHQPKAAIAFGDGPVVHRFMHFIFIVAQLHRQIHHRPDQILVVDLDRFHQSPLRLADSHRRQTDYRMVQHDRGQVVKSGVFGLIQVLKPEQSTERRQPGKIKQEAVQFQPMTLAPFTGRKPGIGVTELGLSQIRIRAENSDFADKTVARIPAM